MVKMVAPAYASLGMHLMISYSPDEEKVSSWHTVRDGRAENLQTIATQYGVPVERLIEFNFPGSAKNGHVDPDIVNWYLFHHERFRCHATTQDGMNYMFRSGERVAIPYLGHVEIGMPEFLSPTNTRFKIMMQMNVNVGVYAAAGVDFSIFTIWDEKAALSSNYTYWAGGASGGVIPRLWASGTKAGPWNDFEVTKAIAVNEFAGAARFTTGGAGSTSVNYLNFMGLPPGVRTLPNPLPISTGFTLGAGAGTSAGVLKLELCSTPDGLLPYKGP
jgi:hypothetical protein